MATPGRGGQEVKLFTRKDYNDKKSGQSAIQTTALVIEEALGGRENIRDIDACFTRLRVEVSDVSQINEDELKNDLVNDLNNDSNNDENKEHVE